MLLNKVSSIVSHFEEPIWPRTISTHTSGDRQILVYSTDEAHARFSQANFLNCKINAYPCYTEHCGINRQSPNFIFIDLDLSHFKDRYTLDKCLRNTLNRIRKKLGIEVQPTVISSGNGYHIYLPVQAFILELESVFAQQYSIVIASYKVLLMHPNCIQIVPRRSNNSIAGILTSRSSTFPISLKV